MIVFDMKWGKKHPIQPFGRKIIKSTHQIIFSQPWGSAVCGSLETQASAKSFVCFLLLHVRPCGFCQGSLAAASFFSTSGQYFRLQPQTSYANTRHHVSCGANNMSKRFISSLHAIPGAAESSKNREGEKEGMPV